MPTKITPLPKPAGHGGTAGGGTGGGGVPAKPGNKPNTKTAAPRPKLFDSSRFSAARNRLSEATGFSSMTKSRGQGSVSAILFVAVVGFSLTALGIFFVYIGDEKYIVDVMVLGGICLVMGAGSFTLGVLFVVRPIFKERKRQEETERLNNPTQPSLPAQDYVNPAFRMDRQTTPEPVPGTSSQAPGTIFLYDRESLRAVPYTRGDDEEPAGRGFSWPWSR